MTARLENKKMLKENALLDAAFDLFARIGVNGTTIDEIVKKAGVAKGTFYLYFKDKYDILDMVVVRKTTALLSDAIAAAKARAYEDRADEAAFFTGYLIDQLARDKLLMRIIHKNLSLSLYHKVINDPVRGVELKQVVEDFKRSIQCGGYSGQEMDHLLFILLEMTGSVCYSSIINSEPAPIETIKPILLKTIRKILA
ncbi:MAG: TetR/AcrR family transcriptional regulator [Clostridiales bacterium]|jgi:AcrR family transcriptional regulator|nr:TetR/AcrR family transcriptional regulator [Clostridiales bacterium]